MKKLLFLSLTIITFNSIQVKAQGIGELIKTGPADATKLLNAYADPLFKGLGTGLNGGWTNTAKTKGLLHFDVRFGVTGVFVPSNDKSFDVTQIGLNANVVMPADASKTIAPTFGGSRNTNGPTMNIYDEQGNNVGNFVLPSGQMSVIPVPQLQATVGIIGNTDVTLRAIPKFKISNDIGSVSMIGFGIKHNIMQDLVGNMASKVVPFDLAVAAGYTRLNYELNLNVQPSNNAQPKDGQQSTNFSEQKLDGHFGGFNLQLVASKNLVFFTPFIAVGYQTAKTNIDLLGNYPINTGINNIVQRQPTYTTFSNPISVNKNSISSFRTDLGFQLQAGFFKFYASGSLAEYKSVTAGIGLGL